MNKTRLSPELEMVEIYHHYDPQHSENQKVQIMASFLAWPEVYREQLVRVLGEEKALDIWKDGDTITPHTLVDTRCAWVAESIDRLKECTNMEQQFDILSRVALIRPIEEITKFKRIYEETGDIDDDEPNKHGIVRTKLVNGHFATFERQKGGVLSPEPGCMAGRHPCIAPDESFLIFDSYTIDPPGGHAHLFICFRQSDGSWGKAESLSKMLESERNIAASLSPDGKYLFFRAESDIYWISTKIFNQLKK